MKIFNQLLVLLICFICSGCHNNEPSSNNKSSDTLTEVTSIVKMEKDENVGNQIDYDRTKVLRQTFVISRTGVQMKQEANRSSKNLGEYMYGTKLEVIEETNDWLGVRERITRKFKRDGTEIERTSWEKVYVPKSATGPIESIVLLPSDLNVISMLTVNGRTENFEQVGALKRFLKIELIDKNFFESKQSSATNYLLADTNNIKKKNGVIELRCESKIKRYIDRPDAEEERQVFKYEGQFEFLNQYLISGTYYESSDYFLIDKSTGVQTQTFIAFPYISPDKKYILCIYANPYETTADLELYSIKDNTIKSVMSASFKNWMPNDGPVDMFWSSDNYLYLAVNHAKAFWKQDGGLNDQCQYIRIKV